VQESAYAAWCAAGGLDLCVRSCCAHNQVCKFKYTGSHTKQVISQTTSSSTGAQKAFEFHHSGYIKCDILAAAASFRYCVKFESCSWCRCHLHCISLPASTLRERLLLPQCHPEQCPSMAESGESRLKVLARHLLGGGSSSGCPNCACKVRPLAQPSSSTAQKLTMLLLPAISPQPYIVPHTIT
jgi:hypothetical protein